MKTSSPTERQAKPMSNSERGRFITIEGQDGAGKSTNIEAILDVLRAHNIHHISSREPGGTQLGEVLRSLLLGNNPEYSGSLCDMTELLLVFAARAQHLSEVIEPALEQGTWVVCDRFTDATFAYQGGGRGMGATRIEALQELVQGRLRPDLTVLLDVPVDVGENRAETRSKPDRFELENQVFKQTVRETYLQRAKSEPDRIKLVDASKARDTVRSHVIDLVTVFIEKTRTSVVNR